MYSTFRNTIFLDISQCAFNVLIFKFTVEKKKIKVKVNRGLFFITMLFIRICAFCEISVVGW